MASALGIDLGNVYRTVEAVQASRAARGKDEKAQQNALATNAAAANYAANPDDPSAFAGLVALNPDVAKTMLDAFTTADAAERERLDRQNDVLAQQAAALLQSDNPEQAYATFRSGLPPEAQAQMPETFNKDWVNLQLARATEIDKLYATVTEQQTYNRDRADALADDATDHQQAIELEGVKRDNSIAQSVAEAEIEGAGGGALEAADANALFKYSAELFGGVFDAAGNLQNLDPALRSKVQEVATRAEALMLGPEKLPHHEAVRRAAAELGVQFPGAALGGGAPAPTTPGAAIGGAPTQFTPDSDPAGIL